MKHVCIDQMLLRAHMDPLQKTKKPVVGGKKSKQESQASAPPKTQIANKGNSALADCQARFLRLIAVDKGPFAVESEY